MHQRVDEMLEALGAAGLSGFAAAPRRWYGKKHEWPDAQGIHAGRHEFGA